MNPEVEQTRERLERECPRFLGMTADEATRTAEEHGITFRVVDLDAGGLYTMDLRNDRITAEVRNGVVTEARVQ